MADQTYDPAAERLKLVTQRKEMMARLTPKRERVRINPADDDVRRVIKHPHAGPFPASGPADWPLDRFTRRRLLDGSVTQEGAPAAAATGRHPGPQPHRSHQQ
jgi:hypothetical protein